MIRAVVFSFQPLARGERRIFRSQLQQFLSFKVYLNVTNDRVCRYLVSTRPKERGSDELSCTGSVTRYGPRKGGQLISSVGGQRLLTITSSGMPPLYILLFLFFTIVPLWRYYRGCLPCRYATPRGHSHFLLGRNNF